MFARMSLPLFVLFANSITVADDNPVISPETRFAAFEPRSDVSGIARPVLTATVPSVVPGRVSSVLVKEGQAVKQGAPLVALDDRRAKAAVVVARAEAAREAAVESAAVQVRLAQNRLARMEKAHQSRATSSFEVEESRALLDEARANLKNAEEAGVTAQATLELRIAELDEYTIRAPFDGVVVQLHAKQGAAVDGSTPIVTIVDLSSLEAEMFLPVAMYGKLGIGKKVTIVAGEPVGRALRGKVMSIAPVIDSASETFRVVVQIPNADRRLPGGFTVVLSDSTLQGVLQTRAN